MDNLNLLCQTIRFQRTALQNSLAMIAAVQQHGERLLKATLEQSPWIPGESKDACLFFAGIWRKNLTGVSELVDKNLATMERLTSTGERSEKKSKPAERPAAEPTEKPGQAMSPKKQTPEIKQAPEKPQPAEKEAPKQAEHIAKAAIEPQKAVSEPHEKKSEQPPVKQAEKKKPPEPKS